MYVEVVSIYEQELNKVRGIASCRFVLHMKEACRGREAKSKRPSENLA